MSLTSNKTVIDHHGRGDEPIEVFEEQDRYARKLGLGERMADSALPKYGAYGDARLTMPVGKPHYHRDEQGLLVRCYHRARVNPVVAFIVGTTVSFPIEHLLYEKVWPFTLITKWLGL